MAFLRKLLLNVYFWSAIVVLTLLGLAVLPVILLVNIVFLSRSPASGLRRAIRFYGWLLVCVVPFLAPVEVEYRSAKLPPVSIFVANHNSAIDPYLFGAISVENAFVTSWPFRIPVYATFMRWAGYANAGEGWEEVLEKCKKLLENGSSLTIWPEGHRSRDGHLGRFKNGAFSLAVETGYPVVPVCILGSGAVLPPGRRLLEAGKIKLIVFKAVYPGTMGDKKEKILELRNQVRATLAEELESVGAS